MKKIFLILFLFSMSIACGSASSPSPQSSLTPLPSTMASQEIILSDFHISPDTVSANSSSTIVIKNIGKSPHNLTLRDASQKIVLKTPDIMPGKSFPLTVVLPAGTYTAFCSLSGHESLGMKIVFSIK